MLQVLKDNQTERFNTFTQGYVSAQINSYIKPQVTLESYHLRNLYTICSILQYPQDHWESEKDLLKERMDENFDHLP